LESLSLDDRLRKALINTQLPSKLSRDVDLKIAKRQRDGTAEGIMTELGTEGDGNDKLIKKFRERAAVLKMPEGIRKVFDEELRMLLDWSLLLVRRMLRRIT